MRKGPPPDTDKPQGIEHADARHHEQRPAQVRRSPAVGLRFRRSRYHGQEQREEQASRPDHEADVYDAREEERAHAGGTDPDDDRLARRQKVPRAGHKAAQLPEIVQQPPADQEEGPRPDTRHGFGVVWYLLGGSFTDLFGERSP